MFKKVNVIAALVLSASIFVGCGDDSTSTTTPPFLPDAVEADASLATGEAIAQNLMTTSGGGGLNNVDGSSEGANAAKESLAMLSLIHDKLKTVDLTATLNAVQSVNQTYPCTYGGTYTFSGTFDDVTYVYNVTATYANCDEGFLLNGSVNEAGTITDIYSMYGTYTASVLSDYSMKDYSGNGITIYAGTKLDLEVNSSTAALTQTIKINAFGALYGSENTRWVQSQSTGDMWQTSGREYLNNLTAYVDYDQSWNMSLTPLQLSGSAIYGGESQYIFSNGAVIHLTVTGTNIVLVELDADGDGVFEDSLTVYL